MAGIHGLVYVLVGALVIGVSLSVGESFQLFVYIGFGFLGWGAVKVIYGLSRERSAKKTVQKHMDNAHHELSKTHPEFVRKHVPHAHHRRRSHCHHCGIQIHAHDRFCRNCGARLR